MCDRYNDVLVSYDKESADIKYLEQTSEDEKSFSFISLRDANDGFLFVCVTD